ncbi:hypothetical protein UNPF46_11550 [Bradyrhizobium sp. UNPF46]|nr:hypothetical protein UNPF46_11550 [Bradyrhizobium sp. UNPF46]
MLFPGEVLIEFKPRMDGRSPEKVKFKATDLDQAFIAAHKKFVSRPREYEVMTGIVVEQSGQATVLFKGMISRNVNYWQCQFFYFGNWRPANGFEADCYIPMQ